jgi:hypothetical protein
MGMFANSHMSYYARTVISPIGNKVEMGVGSGLANTYSNLAVGIEGVISINAGSRLIGISIVDARGYVINSATSASLKLYKNGILLNSDTSTQLSTPSALTLKIGAQTNAASIGNYTDRQAAFSTIGDGLTDDDATNLYYSTQVFQTTLGRQVGSPAYALPAVNDVNAKLYLSAINSSDPTVNGAVDTFISGLKTDGIYSKMKAVYPFATDNRNLMSYTEDFGNAYWFTQAGSITSNTIAAPNGTTTADSFFENTANQTHGVLKSFTLSSATAHTYSIYVKQLNGREAVTIRFGSSNVDGVNGTYIGAVTFTFATQVISGDNLTSSVQILPNGWYRLSVTVTPPTTSLSIALWSNNGSTVNFAGDVTKGFNLWGAQLELGSTATTYQPMLGSQQAYIATQFKYNMINPQDDDSAFRLVFNGGWTHSPQGATPNGTNGYADTKLNPTGTLTNNNMHLSYYARNYTASITGKTLIGSVVAASTSAVALNWSSIAPFYYPTMQEFTFPTIPTFPTVLKGLHIGRRINSTQEALFINATKYETTQASNNLIPNNTFYLGSNHTLVAQQYTDVECSFSSIGDGLTDTEAANLYTRVQAYQTLLNRQV